MSYIDGFIIPIPKKNIAAYKKMALLGAKVWMEHGALQSFECVGDDLDNAMPGCSTFPKIIKPKKGETILFSFIIYKSKAHRDAVNKKVMNDQRLAKMPKKMPFDPKRVAVGGFTSIVERSK